MLELTESSHTVVFVYGWDGEFVRLISPYQTLYKKRLPLSIAVATCVLSMPHLYAEDTITQAVIS